MQAIAKGTKRVALKWSRRSGKDLFCINLITMEAMKKVGTYFYCLPTAEQSRKILFEGATNEGRRLLSYIPESIIKKIRTTKLQVELVNGSIIEFVGSDEAEKTLVGTNPLGVVFSEAAISQESAWTIAMRAVLLGNDGFALFVSTVRGKSNWFTKLCDVAEYHPEWHFEELSVVDSGLMLSN